MSWKDMSQQLTTIIRLWMFQYKVQCLIRFKFILHFVAHSVKNHVFELKMIYILFIVDK